MTARDAFTRNVINVLAVQSALQYLLDNHVVLTSLRLLQVSIVATIVRGQAGFLQLVHGEASARVAVHLLSFLLVVKRRRIGRCLDAHRARTARAENKQ